MFQLSVSTVVLSAALFACATGTRLVEPDRGMASGAPVRLELSVAAAEPSAFPAAIDPRLPSVDRIGAHVRAALGDTARAAVRLCVAPSGQVTEIALIESSTLAAFDAALLRDARTWQFASLPGPASLQTCSRATISYHPHS